MSGRQPLTMASPEGPAGRHLRGSSNSCGGLHESLLACRIRTAPRLYLTISQRASIIGGE